MASLTRDRVLADFTTLVENGNLLLQEGGFNGTDWGTRWPNGVRSAELLMRARNLIRRTCGEESDHYRDLLELSKGLEPYIPRLQGVLLAARDDFEQGRLSDLRRLIEAEVLGDLLEQAEALLAAGYYIAAASIAGAILEDTLRKLCDAHRISYPSKTKIDSLNAELAKNGVYNKLAQKQITALADIRNNADHGKPESFMREDVEHMLRWVRAFAADHLK